MPKPIWLNLDALEREVRRGDRENSAESHRKVISTHTAFGYFAAAYGIEFIAPLGVSTESEASARDIAGIITQIRATKIPAVFLENISDPRLMGRICGRDRRQGRRNPLFGQPDGRKGRFSHLHCNGQAQYKGPDQRAEPIG